MTLNWNHLAPVERAEKLYRGLGRRMVRGRLLRRPWPGPDRDAAGEVKPCCGFASDLDQLTIGNIYRDTVGVIRRAATSVCRQGLPRGADGDPRRNPGARPGALPGATTNHCFFCWYVLQKAIVPIASPKTGTISLPLVDQAWSPPE